LTTCGPLGEVAVGWQPLALFDVLVLGVAVVVCEASTFA
jgi:hypothetical protein